MASQNFCKPFFVKRLVYWPVLRIGSLIELKVIPNTVQHYVHDFWHLLRYGERRKMHFTAKTFVATISSFPFYKDA